MRDGCGGSAYVVSGDRGGGNDCWCVCGGGVTSVHAVASWLQLCWWSTAGLLRGDDCGVCWCARVMLCLRCNLVLLVHSHTTIIICFIIMSLSSPITLHSVRNAKDSHPQASALDSSFDSVFATAR
jgi:hypothetical protein